MRACRLYEPKDYAEVVCWFRERDLPIPPQDCLPKTGYIVSGIAAGFLYLTDSNVAIIDNYICDPDVEFKSRDLALDLITKNLIQVARASGSRIIKADTQNSNVEERALKHGFKPLGQFSSFFMEL